MKFLNSKTYYIFLFIITLLQSPAHIFAGGSADPKAEKQFNYASFIGLTMLQSTTHIFACVSAHSKAEEQFQRGMVAFVQKNGKEAFRLFLEAGKLNDFRGYYYVGVLYERGHIPGVPKNDKEALSYYKRALELNPNFGDALHAIGVFTFHGRGGIKKNNAEAVRLWELGASFNNPSCYYDLGVCAMEKNRFDKAIELFRKAAPSHNGAACNLGSLLTERFGPGITLDSVMEGLLWLIKSAKSGNKTAIANIKKYPRPTREQMEDSLVKDIVDIQSGKYDNLDPVGEYLSQQTFAVTIPKTPTRGKYEKE